jgi:hypothetical protein
MEDVGFIEISAIGCIHERNPGVTQSWKIACDFSLSRSIGTSCVTRCFLKRFLTKARISKPFLV